LSIPEESTVTIAGSKATFIDHDILETIEDFLATAPDDNIKVETIDLQGKEKIQNLESVVISNGMIERQNKVSVGSEQ
jgi:ribulose bisphosphate carboxylase small subunit